LEKNIPGSPEIPYIPGSLGIPYVSGKTFRLDNSQKIC